MYRFESHGHFFRLAGSRVPY